MKEIGLLASQGIVKPDFCFNVGINFDFLHFRQINFRDPRDLFELSKHPIASHHVTERSFSTPHATQDQQVPRDLFILGVRTRICHVNSKMFISIQLTVNNFEFFTDMYFQSFLDIVLSYLFCRKQAAAKVWNCIFACACDSQAPSVLI